jgi:GTP cyclohydrolase I
MDRVRAKQAVTDFLTAVGRNPDSPDLRETPARVVDAWADELLSGYDTDIGELLRAGSMPRVGAGGSDIVAVRDIHVATLCPHHLLPASGRALVAYRPGSRLLGLGTIARLVEACSKRLALQEAIGRSIVDALAEQADAAGAYCRLELTHSCLSIRGARATEALVATTATAGDFSTAEGRDELRLALP